LVHSGIDATTTALAQIRADLALVVSEGGGGDTAGGGGNDDDDDDDGTSTLLLLPAARDGKRTVTERIDAIRSTLQVGGQEGS
jgi:hypothetical protein